MSGGARRKKSVSIPRGVYATQHYAWWYVQRTNLSFPSGLNSILRYAVLRGDAPEPDFVKPHASGVRRYWSHETVLRWLAEKGWTAKPMEWPNSVGELRSEA